MSKKPNYTILALIAFMSALILAFMPQPGPVITTQTDPTVLADEIVNKESMLHPDILAKWIIDEKADLMIVDIRSNEDYAKYSIPGSENIPVKELLEERKDDINSDLVTVFASNGDNEASQVWLLMRMMGFENVYVLQGGVNYWVENYVAPNKPGDASPDTEIFKYEFRKSAAGHFSGGLSISEDNSDNKAKPQMAPRTTKKKKKARSGCS